jgi:hypothetical protein
MDYPPPEAWLRIAEVVHSLDDALILKSENDASQFQTSLGKDGDTESKCFLLLSIQYPLSSLARIWTRVPPIFSAWE